MSHGQVSLVRAQRSLPPRRIKGRMQAKTSAISTGLSALPPIGMYA